MTFLIGISGLAALAMLVYYAVLLLGGRDE